MSRPRTLLTKPDVLAGLFGSWESIDGLLHELTERQWQADTCLPGWRVHDVVSHLIGTESMLLGIPTPEADCDVAELAHVHNQVAVINECWVRHLRGEAPSAMLDRFRTVTDDRRARLADLTDEQWNDVTTTPAGPDSYGRFMRVRVFDCWMHEQDIREAVALPTGAAGRAAELALDEVAAGIGYIVGKLGQAPDGSRVEVELTGQLRRTLRVAMNGRGRVVDRFEGGDATTTIRLDGVLFTRLTGGRTTAADHRDAIAVTGDTEVGQRIVDHLAFVI